MRRDQLLEAESRLYDLGIFDWSSVGPRKPITDQTDEMALVKVHEAKRNEITYGFGFEVSHRGGNIPTGNRCASGRRRHHWIGWQSDRAQPIDVRQSAGFGRIHPPQHARFGRDRERVHSFVAARSASFDHLFAASLYRFPVAVADQLFGGAQQRESTIHGRPGRSLLSGGAADQP